MQIPRALALGYVYVMLALVTAHIVFDAFDINALISRQIDSLWMIFISIITTFVVFQIYNDAIAVANAQHDTP